jgi:hypothetical protein
MGAAKRRKLAGSYDARHAGTQKGLDRFLRLKLPAGELGVLLKVVLEHTIVATTINFPAARLDELLRIVETAFAYPPRPNELRWHTKWRAAIVERFRTASTASDNEITTNSVPVALWLVLHP